MAPDRQVLVPHVVLLFNRRNYCPQLSSIKLPTLLIYPQGNFLNSLNKTLFLLFYGNEYCNKYDKKKIPNKTGLIKHSCNFTSIYIIN